MNKIIIGILLISVSLMALEKPITKKLKATNAIQIIKIKVKNDGYMTINKNGFCATATISQENGKKIGYMLKAQTSINIPVKKGINNILVTAFEECIFSIVAP